MVEVFSVDNPMVVGDADDEALVRRTETYEAADSLDRLLVGYSSTWPHNHAYAPYMLAKTSRLSLIVAHRPGVMDPAAAARYFATLDVLSGGRLAINVVVGGSDKDLQREGDYSPKAERYARATEYLDVVREAWTAEAAVDHAGDFYTEAGIRQSLKPFQGQVPIFMGGESDDAVEFGAKHADLYMLWGEPLAGTRERIVRVAEAAERHGRRPKFSLSLRVFLGDTDEQAWEQARYAERSILEAQGSGSILRSSSSDNSVGRQRQLATADEELHDDCYWTRLVSLLGGFANSGALVGTPDRVLDSMRKYVELGVDAFLLTTGVDGVWDPSLDDFARRVKKEL
ncbi:MULTISPECIES: LLM class flavin-dependent oxidoreductase [unclassified Aeromicrobium]|uniref:LLM class flavin-dependent oxidoreductase n=1 Tax=unclassified Aeromicrobium TaxID=2633570 RepID=UPI00396B241D